MAYRILKTVLTPIFRYFWRVRVEGLEHVPADGAAILASNHLAVFDSFFLPLALPRRITFVAKAEYFEKKSTAWFFRAAGQIPIKRGGGSASMAALEAAKEVLGRGELFGIYPEGTRSPDGRLYKGHTGVARLAVQCQVPVLAVAMMGTREIQTIGKVVPRFFMPVTIRISAPMTFAGEHADPLSLRHITDEIMYEIRTLSGQEYVNAYAVRKGATPAAGPAEVVAVASADGSPRAPQAVPVAG